MKVAVVSLKFSPGHVAHLQASLALFSSIADKAEMYIVPEYEPFFEDKKDIVFTQDIQKIANSGSDLVYIYNISTKNTVLIKACKKKGIKTAYVLHEPRGSIKELLAEGKDIVKTIGANLISGRICKKVDKVILASTTGMKNYEKYMIRCNRNYVFFPLILKDEYDDSVNIKREYFSFIGGFTEVHACKEFLKFMEYALKKDNKIKFLIATKTNIEKYMESSNIFQEAIESGRLFIQAGRPMQTEEINRFYRQSICVWNAYNRSTQSSVLPNALMQGTPVIVNKNGAAKEIMEDKKACCYISMPPENELIFNCYLYIVGSLGVMENKAREVFLNKYCFSSYTEFAKQRIL